MPRRNKILHSAISMKKSKIVLMILILLNSVVLMGQIYPEGAPPFARVVNIIFLLLSLVFFSIRFKQKGS